MDAELRIRIIDLAWEWVKVYTQMSTGDNSEGVIEEIALKFDQAYKAIYKTVTSTTAG